MNTNNPYYNLFLEILQVEIELFNKLEQQRSIINLKLKKIGGDPEQHLLKIFRQISSTPKLKNNQQPSVINQSYEVTRATIGDVNNHGKTAQQDEDENGIFVTMEGLNVYLRDPYNYSLLDFEEFHLLNITINNCYDSDGEINENEFVQFCLPHRKCSEIVYKRIARNLHSLDPEDDRKELEEIFKECDFEYRRCFDNFLDAGFVGDEAYKEIGAQKVEEDGKPDLVRLIRSGEDHDRTLDFDRFRPSLKSKKLTLDRIK